MASLILVQLITCEAKSHKFLSILNSPFCGFSAPTFYLFLVHVLSKTQLSASLQILQELNCITNASSNTLQVIIGCGGPFMPQ